MKDVEQSEVEYKAILKAGKDPDKEALYGWRSTLIMRLSMLSDSLKAHMDEEEKFFPPIIHQHFTQKQEDAIVEVGR